MVATRDAYQRAIDKAQAMGGTRNILGGTFDRGYIVRGSVAPSRYRVATLDGELTCNCPAASGISRAGMPLVCGSASRASRRPALRARMRASRRISAGR